MPSKWINEARRFAGAVAYYRMEPVSAFGRYLHLYRRRLFSPSEIHFLNLLDPRRGDPDFQSVVSKEELLNVQLQLNDRRAFALTEDKLVFAAHCQTAKLTVPVLHAVYDANGDASGEGAGSAPLLRDEAGLASFMRTTAASDIIVKPINGVHGKGVTHMVRRGDEWQVPTRGAVDAGSLLRLFSETGYRRWMFQQRITGHPELSALSGTDALQTIRVVTLGNADGGIEILAGRLRLIANDGAHDNFDFGQTGNLVANLDLDRGTIRNVIGCDSRRLSMRAMERHPRTDRELIGFTVPRWDHVRELAIAAARAFQPLRTVGWDIAPTADGPCLIEGNVTWDTLIGEPRMGEIYRRLLEERLPDPSSGSRI